jgi:hypothetical protein
LRLSPLPARPPVRWIRTRFCGISESTSSCDAKTRPAQQLKQLAAAPKRLGCFCLRIFENADQSTDILAIHPDHVYPDGPHRDLPRRRIERYREGGNLLATYWATAAGTPMAYSHDSCKVLEQQKQPAGARHYASVLGSRPLCRSRYSRSVPVEGCTPSPIARSCLHRRYVVVASAIWPCWAWQRIWPW